MVGAIRDITWVAARISIDARSATASRPVNSIPVRKGAAARAGRPDVGDDAEAPIPMAHHRLELEVYGSHGMQAWRYDACSA